MVEYKCTRCNKIYNNKYNYNKHLNRKISCKKIIDKDNANNMQNNENIIFNNAKTMQNEKNLCNYCNKNFTHKNNLYIHINNRCKIRKQIENDKKNIFETLLKELNECKEKLKEMDELKQEINLLKIKNNKQCIKNSLVNSNNKITNNIQLIAFGKERLNKIDEKELIKVLKKGFNSAIELTDKIHFNPKIPEYHNIYIPNLKDKYTMIYDGYKWKLELTENVIDDLYDNKKTIIEENIEKFTESLNGSIKFFMKSFIS